VGTFMSRWLGGPFTFGEAAYAAQASLSWQTIAVGDPLYNPNTLSAEQLAKELLQRKSRLAEWFQLRIVNLNQAAGMELDDVISLLERSSMLRQSAVLTEKLGGV